MVAFTETFVEAAGLRIVMGQAAAMAIEDGVVLAACSPQRAPRIRR